MIYQLYGSEKYDVKKFLSFEDGSVNEVEAIPRPVITKFIRREKYYIEYGFMKINGKRFMVYLTRTYPKKEEVVPLVKVFKDRSLKRSAIQSVQSSAGSMIKQRKINKGNEVFYNGDDTLIEESASTGCSTNISTTNIDFFSFDYKNLDDYYMSVLNVDSQVIKDFHKNLDSLKYRIQRGTKSRNKGKENGEDKMNFLISKYNFECCKTMKLNGLIRYFEEYDILIRVGVYEIERRFTSNRKNTRCTTCFFGDGHDSNHECSTNHLLLTIVCIHISTFIGERYFDKKKDISFHSMIMSIDEIVSFLSKNLDSYFQLRFKLVLLLDGTHRKDTNLGFQNEVINKYNEHFQGNTNEYIRVKYTPIGNYFISTNQCIMYCLDLVFTDGICYHCGGIFNYGENNKGCGLCSHLKYTNSLKCFTFKLWYYDTRLKSFPRELVPLLVSPLYSFYHQYANMRMRNPDNTDSFIHCIRFDDIGHVKDQVM